MRESLKGEGLWVAPGQQCTVYLWKLWHQDSVLVEDFKLAV